MSGASVELGVRQDLRTFFYPAADDIAAQQRRDLFILGFQRFQSLPSSDPDSYVQLASVHGRPMSVGYGVDAEPPGGPLTKMQYVDRAGDQVAFSNMGVSEFGYCKHGRPTFIPWHRPYVYLVERAIRRCARDLIESGAVRGDLDAARHQVDLVRLPYWNWAVQAPVPDVLLCDQIELRHFHLDGQGVSSASGAFHAVRIPNPFKAFRPDSAQFAYFNGEVPDPSRHDAPQGVTGTLTDYDQNCVFGPDGTLRQPGWSDYLYRYMVDDLRKNLAAAFAQPDFVAADGTLDRSASHWMETAHNHLHNAFGLAMSATKQPVSGRSAMPNDMSPMDPAFWFHHCFVDCQLAMHRLAYPRGRYVPAVFEPVKDRPAKEFYAETDPVPGDGPSWLHARMHPWTKGLFPEIFGSAYSLEAEIEQLRNGAKTADVEYVDAETVESSTRWGYTYDMLLTEPGHIQVDSSGQGLWLAPEKALAKFQSMFSQDPFYSFLQRAHHRFQLPKPIWEMDSLPEKVRDRLRHAVAADSTVMLHLVLPKFFAAPDGAAGRSYTVNVFVAQTVAERHDLVRHASPASLSFAGSASVFAPFNLPQCVNCQRDNLTCSVAIDLTDALIHNGLTHLHDQDVLDRIVVSPVGLPKTATNGTVDFRDRLSPRIVRQKQASASAGDETGVKLLRWKKDLAAKMGQYHGEGAEGNHAKPAVDEAWSQWRHEHPDLGQLMQDMVKHGQTA